MSTIPTFDEVRQRVAADDQGKWDTTLPARDLRLDQGELAVPSGERHDRLAPNEWATRQLCDELAIPSAYFQRCPPELKDAQFNHWVARVPPERSGEPRRWLLRSKGATLRAALSSQYSVLDNATLLSCAANFVDERFEVKLATLTERSFHLRLVDRYTGREVLRNDRLMVGLHISNSEVGLRAVTVDALVYRLVCTNGLIRLLDGKSVLSKRHIHLSTERLSASLGPAIGKALRDAELFIDRLQLATLETIRDVDRTVERLAVRHGFDEALVGRIRSALLQESLSQQDTLYGLVNALTSAAQSLQPDERYGLETLAGHLLDRRPDGQHEASLAEVPQLMAAGGER